jgi:hypothetical protein
MGLGGQVGQDLSGLRGNTLNTLEQVSRGQMPQAITDLFRGTAGPERDVLEMQFQNARNQMLERSPTLGGNLSSNLANLDTNRAISLAQQEQARGDQARAVAANLFGMSAEQGLTAPGQQAGLYGQASSMFGQAEQGRQGALSGALSAMDTAAQRDLQAQMQQQAALVQQQQLAQSLAGQYGANADQLQMALPGILGQIASLAQGQAVAPAIPAQILQGVNLTPGSSYLGQAMQGNQGLIGSSMDAQIANQQAASQGAGGTGALIGQLGGAALMAFT